MKRIIISLSIIGALLAGCAEEKRLEISLDKVAPAPVSGVEVRNIPGGAVLKYKVPADEDLLFVKAVYSYREGHRADVRSSLYCDSVTIEGYGTEDEQKVQLIAVDRSNNESTPVEVTIKPLEAPVVSIVRSMKIVSDFGGLHLSWKNPGRAPIAVMLERKDHNNEYVPLETFYSALADGDVAARGLDSISADFRVYVRDRWENRSEIRDTTLTPMFEELFDRTLMQEKSVPGGGDEPCAWAVDGWLFYKIFDGVKVTVMGGYHSKESTLPQWITWDMGITGKVSRIKIWQRDGYLYGHGNLRRFEIWGARAEDESRLADWSVWTKMMDCTGIKPSGLPAGTESAEDRDWAHAGEEFSCSPELPAASCD